MRKILIALTAVLLAFSAHSQIKISALPSATGKGSGGWLPIVESGVTKKIMADSVAALAKFDSNSLSNRINTKISDIKRSKDSVYINKTGTWVFAYKDSTGGGLTDAVDSIYRKSGKDSIYWTKSGRTYQIKDSSGVVGRFVDSIYRTSGKDSIFFNISGTTYKIRDSIGITKAVDSIYRTSGKDSIFFKISGTTYRIKDSTGGATFTKNIIMNGSSTNRLGNYVNGDIIPVAGLSLDSAFKIITQKAYPPTYINPTTSISSSPSASIYEIGSNLGTITLSSTFTQNDAGSLTGTTYYKNNVTALGGNTDVISSLTSTTQYKVTKSYNQGACKPNNLGDIDCTGRINAGSITSSNITFTPVALKYWGYSSSSSPTSGNVVSTNGGGSEFAYDKSKGSFSIVISGTNQYVYYAYPTSLGTLSSIIVSGLESIGAFNQTTVSVTNAQGYVQNYYVYTSQNQFNNTTVTFTSVN